MKAKAQAEKYNIVFRILKNVIANRVMKLHHLRKRRGLQKER